MNQVAELLEKAADALESGRIQWGKYTGFTNSKPPGTMCAVETIEMVAIQMGLEEAHHQREWRTARSTTSFKACTAVSLHVTKGQSKDHLTAWNDTEARTLDEVVQAFKETAKDLRNQEGS
jgi:NADPH-dependent glutamate synthase beta subunit-like oxidoreductase